jgi:hypothetical protein
VPLRTIEIRDTSFATMIHRKFIISYKIVEIWVDKDWMFEFEENHLIDPSY